MTLSESQRVSIRRIAGMKNAQIGSTDALRRVFLTTLASSSRF